MSSSSSSKVGDTMTTLAVGEEDKVKPAEPMTTLALGEEEPVPAEQKPRSSAAIPGDNALGAW